MWSPHDDANVGQECIAEVTDVGIQDQDVGSQKTRLTISWPRRKFKWYKYLISSSRQASGARAVVEPAYNHKGIRGFTGVSLSNNASTPTITHQGTNEGNDTSSQN